MQTHLSNLFMGIGIVFVFFFIYAAFKKRSRNGNLFSLMCLAVAIFIVGYSLELRATTIEQLQLCLKLEYFGAPFMTVFWFMFAYKFYYDRHVSFRLGLLIMVVPVITLFFNVNNDYFRFLYHRIDFIEKAPYLIADLTRGPWYYFYSIYSYVIILYGCYLFFKIWRTTHNDMIKQQSLFMFIGTVIPVISNILYLVGVTPTGIDITPFGLLFLAIFYGFALFKYDALELKEIVKTLVFEEIDEGILVIDNHNCLIEFNEAAAQVFPWINLNNIGMDISQFEHGESITSQKDSVFSLSVPSEDLVKSYEFRKSSLEIKKDPVGEIIFFRDMTTEKQMVEKLDLLASYDTLSQVFNRRKLIEESDKEAIRAMRYYDYLSILMIDIDLFKQVNDRYGHLAGDQVIYSVAQAIKSRIRAIDIVGRYGGEEFVAVLSNANHESALRIAETIRQDIENRVIQYEEVKIQVTVSIGVAVVYTAQQPVIPIMEVINLADRCMYQAKALGRNKVIDGFYNSSATLRMSDETL